MPSLEPAIPHSRLGFAGKEKKPTLGDKDESKQGLQGDSKDKDNHCDVRKGQ